MKTRIVAAFYRRRALFKRILPLNRTFLLKLPQFRIFVRLDDWAIGARIALLRSYEPHVSAALSALLRPGMVVADVGANIGYHTLLAASLVGPSGHVLAFEPSAENCALIERSLAANQLSNVSLTTAAVAAHDGTIGYQGDESNGWITESGGAQQVRALRLDSALADLPRLDLIKMDIEGAEALALRGMAATLARWRPALICEFSPSALRFVSQASGEELLASLRAAGYQLATLPDRTPQSDAQIMGHIARHRLHHVDLLATPLGGW